MFILNGLLAWRFTSLDLYLKNSDRETETARRFLKRVRKVPMAESLEAHCAQVESLGRAGFARRLRRTGWRANFISYDSTKWACCQDKYILGELLVRTDWQVIGGARVTEDKYERNAIVFVASGYSGGGRKGQGGRRRKAQSPHPETRRDAAPNHCTCRPPALNATLRQALASMESSKDAGEPCLRMCYRS